MRLLTKYTFAGPIPSCASSETMAGTSTATAYIPRPSGPRLLARMMLVISEKPKAAMRVASVSDAELTRPRRPLTAI